MKKYIAEFFGTLVLTLAVALSISGVFPVSTPVIAAFVVGVLVYTMAHISGTHINPAVTFGAWAIKKINSTDALGYLVSQFLGAGVGLFVARYFVDLPTLTVTNSSSIGILEGIGAFILMFSISSVIYGKSEKNVSGLVIGGGLLVGIAMAVLGGSNGVLNPAVAFGIGSLNLSYVLGPIIGAVLGAVFYKKVFA